MKVCPTCNFCSDCESNPCICKSLQEAIEQPCNIPFDPCKEDIEKALITQLDEIKKRGFWKEGKFTYIVHEYEYPHDERCEGMMCYCESRAKKENSEKHE